MSLITIAIGAAIINNFLLVRFLGMCPFFGVSKSVDMAVGMGLAVTFVMTISGAVCSLIFDYILIPFDISYVRDIAFIFIIASLVQVIEMYLKKSNPTLYKSLGIYLPLITTNCAVLGVTIINVDEKYNLIESIVNSCFAALGFTLVLVVLASIREKLAYSDVPKHFKGFPITLMSAGLMALAWAGFSGLI